MDKAPIVLEWLATNPTEQQKEIIQRYYHQVVAIMLTMGTILGIAISILFLIIKGAL
jgi:hypothetical protein